MLTYIEKKDLPPHLRHLGNVVKVHAQETLTIPADAGTWSGGTRYGYEAIDMATGRTVSITDTFSPPWDAGRKNKLITLVPGYAVLETGHFCGKAMTPHLYVHPSQVAIALPAPAPALTDDESKVLAATCAYKSAYRREELKREGLDDPRIDSAKRDLVLKGLLDSRGAVTVKGRNVIAAKRGY